MKLIKCNWLALVAGLFFFFFALVADSSGTSVAGSDVKELETVTNVNEFKAPSPINGLSLLLEKGRLAASPAKVIGLLLAVYDFGAKTLSFAMCLKRCSRKSLTFPKTILSLCFSAVLILKSSR